MNDSFTSFSFPPPTLSSNDHPVGADGNRSEATVISAKFSERSVLSVHMVADELLSHCWSKGCEFARNFNAPHIDIEHLLLGASHVRDAELTLATASDDVEELTHELGRLCARRSFAEAPRQNTAYEASQTLKVLLCEAAALATKKQIPNLTLALLMEALAETEPRPGVLDILPKVQRRTSEKDAQGAAHITLLKGLHNKIENVESLLGGSMLPKLDALASMDQDLNTALHDAIRARLADTEAGLRQGILSLMEGISRSARQNSEELNRLINLLANPPQDDPANPDAPNTQHTLKIPTTEQVYDAVRLAHESAQAEDSAAGRSFSIKSLFHFWHNPRNGE